MDAIGIIGKDSLIMIAMRNFDLFKETLNFIVNRTINGCITTTYYIFCMHNREWENPEILNLKTDTNVLSNMPYSGHYYCKSG